MFKTSASKPTRPAISRVKILGDNTMSDFIDEVQVSTILELPFEFIYASTLTSLTLELDSHGTESVMVIGCMSSILDTFTLVESSSDVDALFDKIRIAIDSYLSRPHSLYVCPPMARSTSRTSAQYVTLKNRFHVS